ncbi:hypothetical protein K0M31_012911 [Melipona bicolor]|uniref:Uncharacterized protein n=1 Tax=Melipona bicolor TaxID=60889 RepID=A0AA40KH31_9HYME|nr:hypothetical protein K0M31_012911 [Melipona bicolor]
MVIDASTLIPPELSFLLERPSLGEEANRIGGYDSGRWMIPGIRRLDPFRISFGDFGADGSFHSVDLANKLSLNHKS